MFCKGCGMLKSNCICGNIKNSSENEVQNFDNLSKENPDISDEIIQNFPFEKSREGQLKQFKK